MNADPLDALKDIYLPVEPHWWPPAPGWWITAALILAVLWWSGRRFWAYRAATQPIRAAQRIIDTLIEEEATIPTVNPRRNHGVEVAVTAEPAPTAASWRFGDKTASPATNTRWLRL